MAGTDRISVVIPVYNGAAYVGEAIASVRAQSPTVTEIIVVDDGSTDGSAAVAGKIAGVRVVTQENAGQAAARNRGAELAQDGWLAFLDADDLWAPGKLALQLDAFEQDPKLDLVFGHALQFRHGEQTIPEMPALPMPAYLPGAMLLKRETFLRVGGYRSDWKVGEVVEWYARTLDLGLRTACLPEVLLYRRVHGDNLGVRERGSRHDYARVLKHVLDRRRAAADETGEGPPP
jgi:glycosyltransferase involved in cell wall biosynthesis